MVGDPFDGRRAAGDAFEAMGVTFESGTPWGTHLREAKQEGGGGHVYYLIRHPNSSASIHLFTGILFWGKPPGTDHRVYYYI